MKKAELIHTLSFPMLLLGIGLCSVPYIALIRAAIGIDETVRIAFTTTLIFLIGGYMAALGAMIYLSRHAQQRTTQNTDGKRQQVESVKITALKKPHYLGLLMFTPIPFISFIAVYWFWCREGMNSHALDTEYRKSLNFQITIHLYWLLSFFLMPIFFGFITFAMALVLHFFATLYVISKTQLSSVTDYPANIKII